MNLKQKRIYKYDNVKALLIFLVVIGHMTTDYVSDSHMVRWITLWIYSFHMPAFIFISGLVHKQYITPDREAAGVRGEIRMRWDKVVGFFLCAYALKIFLQITRTAMGQNPIWHWIKEPGIPWYLFVMMGYEMLFFLMRRIDGRIRPGILITASFALSAAIGYFPAIDDTFCLSRFINFLPIYMLGYYTDMKSFLRIVENRRAKILGWIVIISTLVICRFGGWGLYRWRKWFTGRRDYGFLSEYFDYALRSGWWIRLAVWAAALTITFAILSIIPDRDAGFVTTIGARTLQVYFWHRPVCYLFRTAGLLPRLVVMFGGVYDESVAGTIPGHAFGGGSIPMILALIVYSVIGAGMTAFFNIRIFEHPTSDLWKLGEKLISRR